MSERIAALGDPFAPANLVGKFSNTAIQAAVDAAFAALPPDHENAVVAVVRADGQSASLGIAARLNGGWSIEAGLDATYQGAISGSVTVVHSW